MRNWMVCVCKENFDEGEESFLLFIDESRRQAQLKMKGEVEGAEQAGRRKRRWVSGDP
jgi:hypothetical protein